MTIYIRTCECVYVLLCPREIFVNTFVSMKFFFTSYFEYIVQYIYFSYMYVYVCTIYTRMIIIIIKYFASKHDNLELSFHFSFFSFKKFSLSFSLSLVSFYLILFPFNHRPPILKFSIIIIFIILSIVLLLFLLLIFHYSSALLLLLLHLSIYYICITLYKIIIYNTDIYRDGYGHIYNVEYNKKNNNNSILGRSFIFFVIRFRLMPLLFLLLFRFDSFIWAKTHPC